MRTLIVVLLLSAFASTSPGDEPENEQTPQPTALDHIDAHQHPIHSFELSAADPISVAEILTEQFPGFKFSSESHTKTIYGRIPKATASEVQEFIMQVEVRHQEMEDRNRAVEAKFLQTQAAEQAERVATEKLTVHRMEARDALDALNQLGLVDNRQVRAICSGKVIILRGDRTAISEAVDVLGLLDVPATAEAASDQTANAGSAPQTLNWDAGLRIDVPLSLRLDRIRLRNLQLSRAKSLQSYGPEHPRVKLLDEQIAAMSLLSEPRLKMTELATRFNEETDESIDDLQNAYDQSEQMATDVAASLRSLSSHKDANAQLTEACEEMLERAVDIAFEFRMRLQSRQLQEAQKELNAGQKRLSQRRKIKQEIITRRMETLRNQTAGRGDAEPSTSTQQPETASPEDTVAADRKFSF